ncbi:hypothetical protein QQF64_032330 [Cirrhinus molitorella]|uniref:Uncharacterized protein n=1 Tax=Cirrhinus molitorella TaxID=172907 RepID=A0ABR3MZH5_9TELE
MDELDMLLEELAQNSTQISNVPAPIPPKTLQLGASQKATAQLSLIKLIPLCLLLEIQVIHITPTVWFQSQWRQE